MSIYQKLGDLASKFVGKDLLFKYGFNLSPMYSRSTGKIQAVSKDLLNIRIKIPISYRNKNYVNSIFGGSMFSAGSMVTVAPLMVTLLLVTSIVCCTWSLLR